LDLCSGIGGFALGLQSTGYFKTIGFCEIDSFCQKVLKKNFPGVPIYSDIKEFKPNDEGLRPDIITSGFPCQPFSVAGKRKSKKDDRNLWKETFRVIKESKVPIFIGENVGGIVKLYLDTILKDLESANYSTRCFNISASSIGANHQRARIWIVANTESHQSRKPTQSKRREGTGGGSIDSRRIERERKNISSNVSNSNSRMRGRWGTIGSSGDQQDRELPVTQEKSECQTQNLWSKTIGCDALSGETETLQHTNNKRQQEFNISTKSKEQDFNNRKFNKTENYKNWWQTQSELRGIPDGISYGLDKDRANRIKGLGNAIVPQIPYYIGQVIGKMYE
jgi:DNA (cytosine-5)-methyltransferase 1